MEKLIEQQALKIINSAIEKWTLKFSSYSCSFGQIEISRKEEEGNYFSEIEAYVWKDHNVEEVFNIILYLQDKQMIVIKDLESEVNDELQRIFSKIVNKEAIC
jgi:hypothetical protein